MVDLRHIQAGYDFKHTDWERVGEIIYTEKGRKRIVYWEEESLARWHLKWRDQLYNKTGCLTDRVIQTVHEEKVLLFEHGWITLHDEVTSLFSYHNFEKKFGEFLGKYFTCDVDEQNVASEEYSLNTFNDDLIKYSEEARFADPFVNSLRKESLIRLTKAKQLLEKTEDEKAPVVCPLRSLDQGKIIYGNLYWQNTRKYPEKGYRSLKNILSEWLQKYGSSSLYILLMEMNKYFSLTGIHGLNLLAECLIPWEFIEYREQVKEVIDTDELAMWKEKLTYQWENARSLASALSKWLNVTQERVSV